MTVISNMVEAAAVAAKCRAAAMDIGRDLAHLRDQLPQIGPDSDRAQALLMSLDIYAQMLRDALDEIASRLGTTATVDTGASGASSEPLQPADAEGLASRTLLGLAQLRQWLEPLKDRWADAPHAVAYSLQDEWALAVAGISNVLAAIDHTPEQGSK